MEGTKSLDSNAIEFLEKGINFVGRTFENNGVQGKIEKRDFEPNESNTITATVIGNYKYVKYQKEPYYCSQNINKLTPKEVINKWNEKIAYYFVANIQQFVSLYNGQQGGYKLEDIKNHKIRIPIKYNKIDFSFIEELISKLEKEKMLELEKYLSTEGLKDYNLNEKEKEALKYTIKLKEFKIKDLFEIKNTLSFNKDKLTIGSEYDYITRTSQNQGILQTTGFVNKENINEPGVWSLGLLQMNFFYRQKPWYAGQFIRKIIPKMELTRNSILYFTALLNKENKRLSSILVRDVDKTFLNTIIKLPVKNQEIDFEFIEIYISAIKKLVIKNLILYVDKGES